MPARPYRPAAALATCAAALACALVGALALPAVPAAAGTTPSETPTSQTPDPTTTPTPETSTTSPPADAPVPAPVPVPSPSPSATGDAPASTTPAPPRYLSDAQVSRIRAELEESDQAVVDAQLALAESDAEFLAVSAVLQAAGDELARATAADTRAQQELEAARQAAARVGAELEDVQTRMGSSRDTLGQVARSAYQSGAYSSMAVALEAQTPNEFASRLIGVETVVRAENAALAQLSVARADLLDSQERHRAVLEQLAQNRAAAATTLADKQRAQTEAAKAHASLEDVRTRRTAAVTRAEEARQADIAKHADFLALSGEVGRSILAQIAARSAATGPAVATGAWVKPGLGSVNSPFGSRYHPILHYVKLHTGVDMAVADGWVYAADAGVVVEAGPNRAYGNMTVIDHGTQAGSSVTTLYAHQSTMLVRPGDVVAKGQRIGRIGATGYATGPHLHFEIRVDGVPVDPWPAIGSAPNPA